MSNTISSSTKTLLIDKVKNSSPINGVTSYSRKIIHQCKNLFVKSSLNIKNSVKKIFLKQRKIKFVHYKEMQNNINILRHEIRDLKSSLPIHLRDLKNKISHEIDSKLIIENKKKIDLLYDKLNEISAGIYNKNNKFNNSNNDIKNVFSVYKKVAVEHFHRPSINIQENSEKSVSQLFQLTNNSLRVPSDAQSRELTAGPQLPQLEAGAPLRQLTAGPQLPQLEAGAPLRQLTAGPQLPQLEAGAPLRQLTAGPQLPQLEAGAPLRQLTAGPQLPQLEAGTPLRQLTAGPQLPQLEAGAPLRQLTAGPQLPQLEAGAPLRQLTAGPQLLQLEVGAPLRQLTAGPQLLQLEAGAPLRQLTAGPQLLQLEAGAPLRQLTAGPQLPQLEAGAPLRQLTAGPQLLQLEVGPQLLQLTEDPELVEIRANAELGRQLPNYDGNEIATATTATISDLEGTNLSPEMTPAKKLSALQEAGRKVMQDPKSSLAARTAAFHSIAQAQRDLKFSKKRIFRKN